MKTGRIVLAVAFSMILCSVAMALTDEERVKMLDDKFIKGEISEKTYLRLLEKYGGEKPAEKPAGKVAPKEAASQEGQGQYIWIEAEATDGNTPGGYWHTDNIMDASGGKAIRYGGTGPYCGSIYKLDIPTEGKYYIWLRHGATNLITDRYQQVKFEVQIGEKVETLTKKSVTLSNSKKFGDTATWDFVTSVDLDAGLAEMTVINRYGNYSNQLDVILLTTDADYEPKGVEKPAGAIVKN